MLSAVFVGLVGFVFFPQAHKIIWGSVGNRNQTTGAGFTDTLSPGSLSEAPLAPRLTSDHWIHPQPQGQLGPPCPHPITVEYCLTPTCS